MEDKAIPDRDETPGQAAIRERVSAAERDVSQVVRDGFRAGATASEVMQVVIAATAAEAGDDASTRSFRDRLRMHGLNEIVRVLQADPPKAEDFANSMGTSEEQEARAIEQTPADDSSGLVETWLSKLSPAERTDFDRVMRQTSDAERVKHHAEALAAHECRAHPDCGPVTALGQSGHGHHSSMSGLWCWHFSERWIGPLDPPPPEGSDAAMRRAQGCIDGDPSIHKTYPTAGPREGHWSDDFAAQAGLARRWSPVTAPDASNEGWRARGAADAPVAMRAISRAIFDEPHLGEACAAAIIEAYGRDMKRVAPNVASFHLSEARLKLLSSFIADANRTEWMAAFLSAPEDYMAQYRAGFIEALNEQLANWAARPTKPPLNPELVAEEDRWQRALIMGGIGDKELARFFGKDGAKEQRGWRRFVPGGRG
jgi:hypothetical protein